MYEYGDVYNEYKLEPLFIIVNKLCVVPSISRYYRHDINSIVTKEWVRYLQSRAHLNGFNNSSKRIKDEYLFETIGSLLTKLFDLKLFKYDTLVANITSDRANISYQQFISFLNPLAKLALKDKKIV